jgi:FMN phosphatase YigB (HAD superfamily)
MGTVSFDLDGVLIRGAFATGLRPRIWSHLAGTPGLAHLAQEDADRRVEEAIRAAHDRRLAAGELVAAWDWDAIYAEVAHELGGQPIPDLRCWVLEACQRPNTIALLPGAREALERLKAAGLGIVAITNGYAMFQVPALEALDVAELFQAIVTPEVAGFAKPDPRMFQSVPRLAAHVGDMLLHDVLGANLAGLDAVWLQPDLPDRFAALAPRRRPAAPGFASYLADVLERSPYRPYHPEATLERCTPTAVVRDLAEATSVLLEHQ